MRLVGGNLLLVLSTVDLVQRRAAVATWVYQAERQHGEHARNLVITGHGKAAVHAAELAFALAACLDVDTGALARHDNATQILLLQLLVAAHGLVRNALGFQAAHNSLRVAAQAFRELEIAAVDGAAASSVMPRHSLRLNTFPSNKGSQGYSRLTRKW